MLGNGLRLWFELFVGMVVYRGGQPSPGEDVGWLSVDDIERRFKSENLTFGGKQYDSSCAQQKNALLEAILNNAGALCHVKLLERRRLIHPPSLAFRVTKFGRRVDNWGYGDKPGLQKRTIFFLFELFFRAKRYWKLIAIFAACWTLLNAGRFIGASWDWLNNEAFGIFSALVLAAIVLLGALVSGLLNK
jgi:hypothetical protein